MNDYWHFLVVKDLAWRPSRSAAEAVHSALVRWNLVTGKPKIYSVERGCSTLENGSELRDRKELPDNLIFDYGTLAGPLAKGAAAESVMGSAVEGADASIWSILVVMGSDFKVAMNEFHGRFRVVESALEGKHPVEGQAVYPLPCRGSRNPEQHPQLPVQLAYPTSWTGRPPRIEWSEMNHRSGDRRKPIESRLWRSGVLLGCGSDTPRFVEEEAGRLELPTKDFVRELEACLASKLVQFGVLVG